MTPKQKKKKEFAKVMRFRKKLHKGTSPGLLEFFQKHGFADEKGDPTELGRNALTEL